MPLDIDRYAHRDSAVQRWDPRIKLASLGVFVLGVALIKSLPMAVAALLSAIVLVSLASLPLVFVLQGVKWVSVFLIPFLLIMPLSYPGDAAFHVLGLPFAWEGFRLALAIMVKALAIVLVAYAMFGSSRFDISMIALQQLKCPKVIVQMLLFTYRYIFVFLAEMQRMDTAMRSRGFVKRADRRTLQVMGDFVGTLLVRSFERTERIYKAMLSKGYQGEFHTLVVFRASGKDMLKAGLVLVLTCALGGVELAGVFNGAEQGWY